MNVDAILTICTHKRTAQLYPQIEASEKISEMSSKFVMISCGDKCEGQKGFRNLEKTYLTSVQDLSTSSFTALRRKLLRQWSALSIFEIRSFST